MAGAKGREPDVLALAAKEEAVGNVQDDRTRSSMRPVARPGVHMRIHELLNKRADKALWSMAPCEICDAPTRWVLSPYCHKCEWLIAFWRDGRADPELTMGDMPPETALDGDTALSSPSARQFFNDRGFYIDPLCPTRMRRWGSAWSDNAKRVNLVQVETGHWSTVAVRDFNWRYNEQNEKEKISLLERSINEKD